MKHRWAATCILVLLLFCALLAGSCGSSAGDNGGSENTTDNTTENGTTDNGSIDSSSDNGSSTTDTDNLTQKYLFEVSYINWAWGYQDRGIYIDRDGRVCSYDLSDRKPRFQYPEDRVYTRAMLDDKYSGHCVLIGTVDLETLAAMSALVGPASQGQLTEPVHTGCDFGGEGFTAFLFDAETGTYTSVLLRQCGDWSRQNTAPEAATLHDWLTQYY